MSVFNSIIASAEHTIQDHMKDAPDSFWGDHGGEDFSAMFPDLAQYSIVAGVAVAVAFGLLLWLGSYLTPQNIKGRFLRASFVVVWFYGLVVYDIGMCTGEYISLIANAPMAILYAFKIFLLDSDVSEIHEAFHSSWVYSLNFALVHFFAAIISTLFVIKYFGFNILAKWRMYQEARFKATVDESFVIWGLNDASAELIKSITSHYAGDSDDSGTYRIVLVRISSDDDDNPEARSGIGRIFDFLSIPTSDLDILQKLKCLTVGTYSNIYAISTTSEDEDVIRVSLKLRTLKRILQKRTRRKIHMVFLGDNENDNLHAVSLLLHDITLKRFAGSSDADSSTNHPDRQVIFYCHARYNSVHRVIEDQYMDGNLRVKVIDSSHISVERLKLDDDLLPVNFVRVEDDATVSTPFNSLVVGFSEVGQDVVRFLYEYGAFVKTGSTDAHVERSEFHLRVVDKQMADVAGAFVANAPAIRPSIPFIHGMENPKALIEFYQLDCRSIEFYKRVESWIKALNYIVVATDDDELNLTLAVRIFKLAARYRRDMSDLCILTRVREDDDGHARRIAEHYNRLWLAQQAVMEYNGKIATQHRVKRNDAALMPIHLFGLDKQTYTYRNVIDDSMERQAIEFKERYTASTTLNYTHPTGTDQYAWHAAIRDNIRCIYNDPDNSPTLSAMMGIRRMQTQDFANCFHASTKMLLSQKALAAAGIPEFKWEVLSRKSGTTVYTIGAGANVSPQILRILDVLAQTEHLRWNASHELLGYVNAGSFPSRNEVQMSHSCITNWQNLTTELQSHDYDVIDVTLNIINPERPIRNQ